MSKAGKAVAVSALAAAAAGYVAGILTAPKSGRETRRDIQKAALKARRQSEKKLKDLNTELNTLLEEAKTNLHTAKGRMKEESAGVVEMAHKAKDRARVILSSAHEGDAGDEDLRQAINDVNDAITHLKKFVSKKG